MPKTKSRGGKKSRKSKNQNQNRKRELLFKGDLQEYAVIERMFGDSRVEAKCYDDVRRVCKIRGKMRKRIYINVGDTVLVSLRDFQSNKADLIHKYYPCEVSDLIKYKEITKESQIHDIDKDFIFEDI